MIRLSVTREPRWLDLGDGVSVLAKPLTTAIHRAATATALRKARQLAEEKGLIDEAGGSVFDIPDPFDLEGIEGLRQQFILQTLAQHAIAAWKGIGDEAGNPAPVTPANVAAFIRDFPLHAARFESLYLYEIEQLAAEKNGCTGSPNGTTAAEPVTAEGASPSAADAAPTTSMHH